MKRKNVAAAWAAVAVLGAARGTFAADMATKAPEYKPTGSAVCGSILDFFTTGCDVSAYGVRFYGTVDVGVSYQTNGTPVNHLTGSGLQYTPQKQNNGAQWLPASNAMGPTSVGFTIAEPLGGGWKFVGQIEAAFDPYSLALRSGSDSLRADIGDRFGSAKGSADSSLQGSFDNSLGFAGVSNDTWGILTFGRQGTVLRDVMLSYDPAGGSNGFGLIGGSGTLSGGGSTETTKGNTGVKYRVNVANYRVGLFAQFGDYNEGNASKAAYQANLGGDFKIGPGVLSVDGVGGFTKDAVSESLALSGGPSTLPGGAGNPDAVVSGVSATITDNTYASVGAKYTIDRLKLYAGYEWIRFANPADGGVNAFTDIAGNGFANVAGSSFIITNGGLANDKIWNIAWAGVRYSLTNAVDIYGAYYHQEQGQFIAANNTTCAVNGERSNSACHGTENSVTAVIDWQFAPKWDTYVGTTLTQFNGGLANGYLHTQYWATSAGVRFRW